MLKQIQVQMYPPEWPIDMETLRKIDIPQVPSLLTWRIWTNFDEFWKIWRIFLVFHFEFGEVLLAMFTSIDQVKGK